MPEDAASAPTVAELARVGQPVALDANLPARRTISPALLGKAALRIGSREAGSELGLALAAFGLVLAGLRRAPQQVTVLELSQVGDLIPPEHRGHAESILATARGLVEWLAGEEDALLAEMPVAGNA
jgi:hypothetical protein